jgi:DNA-binding MarR family transcriptional regulator
MDGGAVTRLADRLEAHKFIKRVPDPEDGRSVLLKLTDQGRDLVPALAAAADATDEQFFGVLSDQEVAQLRRLMTKLLTAANDTPDKNWSSAPLRRKSFKSNYGNG